MFLAVSSGLVANHVSLPHPPCMPSNAPQILAVTETVKEKLVACVISLSDASKWAGRDRFSFNPLNAVIAMPMKYWHLRKSKQHLARAQDVCLQLQQEIEVELNQAEIEVSKIAIALDLWGKVSGWSESVPGGGVAWLGEMWANVHIESQVETSLVSVNGLLDDVGLLCAKLRSVEHGNHGDTSQFENDRVPRPASTKKIAQKENA